MSKGNMLLGHARGKVGDLVFSRNNGEQVVRARAAVVKNPQTTAQMVQRIVMNTIVSAYSAMSSIVDHSFEGVAPGQQSMSFFQSRNIKRLRARLAEVGDFNAADPLFVPIGQSGLASYDYEVAKGTLPEIVPVVGGAGASIALSANTYAAAIDAVGGQRGDQLTLIVVSGSSLSQPKFDYCRIILDPIAANGDPADLSVALINADGSINLPNPRNENTGVVLSYSNQLGLEYTSATTVVVMAAAILSRKVGDVWKRSNASLIAGEGVERGYNMAACLAMFESGGINTTNPRYLNNASSSASASATAQDYLSMKGKISADAAVTDVTIVGLDVDELAISGGGALTVPVLVDADGRKYYIANSDSYSQTYGSVVANFEGWEQNAESIAAVEGGQAGWVSQSAQSGIINTAAAVYPYVNVEILNGGGDNVGAGGHPTALIPWLQRHNESINFMIRPA